MRKALAIVAIMLAAQLTSSCESAKKAVYRDSRYGWTVSYPDSLQKTVVNVDADMVSLNGVVIANFDGVHARKWLEFRRFPPDGAAFGFLLFGGGPAPDTTPPEARFPLSPASFTLSRATEKPAPKPRVHGIVANGTEFVAEVWFGPRSSRASREAIWNVVRSLRFPPQRTGTMSGDHYVLEDASHYPLNSVTPFKSSRLSREPYYFPPFYLVHAPGGFYAVSWEPKFEPICHMSFDRPLFQFYCRTSRGRWDRMGRVLEGPESSVQYNDSLDLGHAKIGRDGQVLVGDFMNLGTGNPMYSRYEHRFWPASQ